MYRLGLQQTERSSEVIHSLAKSTSDYFLSAGSDADIPTQLKRQIEKLQQIAEEQKQTLSAESRQTRDTVLKGSEDVIKAQSQKTAELVDAIRRLHDNLGTIINAIGRDDDLQTSSSLRHRLEELSRSLQAMQTSTAQSLRELDSLIENNNGQPSWVYRVVAEFCRSVMASSMTFVAWVFARPVAQGERYSLIYTLLYLQRIELISVV